METNRVSVKERPQGPRVVIIGGGFGGHVSLSQGVTRLSSHQPAVRLDFVCEKGHGGAPIPFDDKKIAEVQKADLRCIKH